MPGLMVGRVRAVVLGVMAAVAAAPAAQGQAYPRWQVEASLDHTGSASAYGVIADGVGGGYEVVQMEAVRYSVGVSRLTRVIPRTSLRVGLSLANRGFTERTRTPTETEYHEVDLLYLGAPVTVGYNLVNASPGLRPVVEAGVVPEVLLRGDAVSEFDYDLSSTGLSWLVSMGLKYNLRNGRSLLLAPELRMAARGYSRRGVGLAEYEPSTLGLKLGVQF
jgi:hypothetical protein